MLRYADGLLTKPERDEARRLFAEYGYTQSLAVAHVISDDERIFVVSPDALAKFPAGLTEQLQQALHRKVWIVSEGDHWAHTEPLC